MTAPPKPPAAALSSSVTTSRLPRRRVDDQPRVEGLGEPGVDDTHRPALGRQPVGDLDAAHHDGPEAHDEQLGALAQRLALADGDEHRLDLRQVEARRRAG